MHMTLGLLTYLLVYWRPLLVYWRPDVYFCGVSFVYFQQTFLLGFKSALFSRKKVRHCFALLTCC